MYLSGVRIAYLNHVVRVVRLIMFALAYHILSSISMLGTWFVLFRPFGLFDKIGESNG